MNAVLNIIIMVMLIAATVGFGGMSVYGLVIVIGQLIMDGVDDFGEGLIGVLICTLCITVICMFIGVWVAYIGGLK